MKHCPHGLHCQQTYIVYDYMRSKVCKKPKKKADTASFFSM
jgi:hypothetical protein